MSRTKEQINESLTNSIKLTDPSIDVKKGAIQNFLIGPMGPTLEPLEADVEHLAGLYSSIFGNVATTEEVEALATSFSIQRATGKKATVIQHFVRFTQPGLNEILTVPAGTLVSNADGSIVYQTLEEVILDGNNASSFFNASRSTYEVSTKVQAVSSGEESNLPSFRINKITTSIDGFDLTENRSDALGGSADETDEKLVKRTESKFNGINTGTPGGLISFIKNEFPIEISDVSIIQPRDKEFKRFVNALSLDVNIIGQSPEVETESFTALAGDLVFDLSNSPVLRITSATVNGVETAVGLSVSADDDTKFSVNSTDSAVFQTPLQVNDIVVVVYEYNKTIPDVQNLLSNRLFDTDILVRQAFPVELVLEARVRTVASVDNISLESEINSKIKSLIEGETFIETLTPSILEDKIRDEVVGIISFDWIKFQKKSGSFLDVELIELLRNEVPKINDESFKVTVVSVQS